MTEHLLYARHSELANQFYLDQNTNAEITHNDHRKPISMRRQMKCARFYYIEGSALLQKPV